MEKLNKISQILNLLKYEHKLSIEEKVKLSTFEDEFEDARKLERSLNEVNIATDDVKMLTLINLFLDITDNESISTETSLMNKKFDCESLWHQYYFFTKKLKNNQDQINKLECDNAKLKADLRLNKINKFNQSHIEEKTNLISPSYIQSSFKFDIVSEKAKKYFSNNDDFLLPPKMKILYDLVMQYTIKGNYAVAIPLCEQTLTDIERKSSKYCDDYVTMMHVLANVYRDIGDYQKSINLMLEILIIRENSPETPKIKIVKVLNYISVLHGMMYCWKEAALYCRRSLLLMREIYEGEDVNIAKQSETMALIYKNNNQSEEAIEALQVALAIYHCNGDSSDIIRVQSQIASCYLSQLRFDVSLNTYKEIIINAYQLHLYKIWGIKKPLWEIAEDYQCGTIPVEEELKSNYIDIRLLDCLDVSGLRDVLYHMALIYRQLNMNKAARFLETWPDRNIPTSTLPNRSCKSRSLMNVNEENELNDLRIERPRLNMSRRSLNYLVPGDFKVGKNSKKYINKRSSVSMPRKSNDFEVTIFDAWTQSFNVKRQH